MAGAGSQEMERIKVHVDGQYVQVNCAKQGAASGLHLQLRSITRFERNEKSQKKYRKYSVCELFYINKISFYST